MNKYLREPINSITHWVGALLSLLALLAMVVKASNANASTLTIVAVCIFGVSLILLYSTSATYHSVISSDKVILTLRKLDHSMIFILIAGSYAPFCLIALNNTLGKVMFGIMISVAIAGIVFKLCWFNCPRWLQSALYIAMGWSAIFVVKPMAAVVPFPSLFLLVLGGILYTVGGVLYALKPAKLQFGAFGFHEIFHIFILLGSLAHFISVFTYIL